LCSSLLNAAGFEVMNQKIKYIIGLTLLILGSTYLNVLKGQELDNHRWKNRILIVQTNNEKSESYMNQLKEFNNSIEGFKERKLVLYQFVNSKFKFTDFGQTNNDGSWDSLSKSFHVKSEEKEYFKIILIGLDGGIKLEQTKLLEKEDLFDLIDSMPMRRSELRKIE